MKRQRGYTLLEAIATLAIASILLAVAVPSMRIALQNNRAYMASKEFVAMLQYARYEAIKRGVTVSVCAQDPNDPSQCVAAASYLNDESWSNGWLVFVDDDADAQVAAVGDILKSRPAIGETNLIESVEDAVSYDGNGFPTAGTGDFTFRADGCEGENGRLVSISPSGRASVTTATCI